MAIHWRLKTYLAVQHGIFSSVAFQKKIIESTGVIISAQNLRVYLNQKPKLIPLKTMELICTALQCELSSFCEVKPKSLAQGKIQPKKLSFHNTPLKKRANGERFPDPTHYESLSP
jgi:DNA-binding Xre family transcriptional regulator